LTFSEPVTVSGSPQLGLNSGGTAVYTSGSETNTLTFGNTVAVAEGTPDLDYVSTSSLTLNGSAIQDGAGNAAVLLLPSPGAAGSLGANKNIVIDTTPPTITAAATTSPNGNGWYKGNVTVHFTCSDTGSGIPAGACPAEQILTSEGAAVSSVAETVTDNAGLTSATSNVVTVEIDKTAPSDAPTVTGTAGTNGWFTSDVSVAWNWSDGTGSGVDASSCTQANSSSGEGAAVTVSSACKDIAGNGSSDSLQRQIDNTAPNVTCNTPTPAFQLGSTGNQVTATVTDVTSGQVASLVSAAAPATAAGPQNADVTGRDNAGNTTVKACSYVVGYRFGGFTSPLPKSKLNARSSLPVKFSLQTANGQPISTTEAQSLVGATCKITVKMEIGGDIAGCPTYDARLKLFQLDVKLTNAMKGNNGVSVRITFGTSVVTTSAVDPFTVR
jgi:hypothetical protein